MMISKVNRFIRLLLFYDFILQFAFGLLAPIFAFFVLGNIQGDPLKIVGTATAFYWTARVLTTVPLSRFMDKTDGEKDEYYFLITGTFIISLVPLMYLMSHQAWHIYLIQFIYGLANSMAVPGWRILFTDHLDKGSTGYEWSLDDIAVGISIGASAYIGARLANHFGFTVVMSLVSIMGLSAVGLLLKLKNEVLSLAQLKRTGQWFGIFKQRRRTKAVHLPKTKYGAV